MALQQSLGLGVEITLQDRFTPVAMKVISSYASMREAITRGAQDIARAGQMMGASMGAAGAQIQAGAGKKGGKGGGGSGFGAMQSVIGGVTTAMVALKGVTAGFNAFDGVTKLAGTFDKSIVSAGAIMGIGWKDAGGEMKKLEKAAIDAGIATQFSPLEAAAGLEILGQSGYNATEATKLLIPALDLAAGGQISVAQASATTSAAVKIFKLDINQAAVATDKLLRISNATALTAGDLQQALGNVSRGAIVTGQSLDEMLPSVGLVKNAGVDASVAASSVSSALLMVAKNADKFEGIGVKVTDAAGQFKPFLSIVKEAGDALKTKFPNAATRSAKAMELFGKFGLTSFAAITSQLEGGITGSKGQTIFGQEAIDDLRMRMGTAEGAAREFRDKLLDTFEGQKTLLKGSMETLGVVIGQPLTKALRPVVEATINVVNRLISVVQNMPDGLKVVFAKIALGAAMFGSFMVAAIGVGAGLAAIAGPVMEVVGALGTLAPIAAGLGVIFAGATAVFAAFKTGYQENIGGFGAFVSEKFNWVKLAVQGLIDVFSTGEISGALADELSTPENEGILNFIGRIYAGFNQLMSFVDNFVSGFKDTIRSAEVPFQELSTAIEGLLSNFSGLTGAIDESSMDASFNKSNASGMSFGKTVANIAILVIRGLTIAIDVVNGMIQAWDRVGAVVSPIGAIFSEIGGTISELVTEFNSFGDSAEGSGGKAITVGTWLMGVFGAIGGFVVTAFGLVKAQFISFANIFAGVGEVVVGVINGDWGMAFRGLKRIAFGVITSIIGMVGFMVEALASAADYMAALVGKDLGAAKMVRGFKDGLINDIKSGMGLNIPIEVKPSSGSNSVVPPSLSAPANDLFATNEAAAGQTSTDDADLFATNKAADPELLAAIAALGKRPIEVTVNVDPRSTASASSGASADEAARGYSDNTPSPD